MKTDDMPDGCAYIFIAAVAAVLLCLAAIIVPVVIMLWKWALS